MHKETADNIRDLSRGWLERNRDRSFFLYIHLIDPHWPYYKRGFGLIPELVRDPRRPYSHVDLLRVARGGPAGRRFRSTPQLRELVGRYDEEIRFSDQFVHQMIEDVREFRLGDSTLIVVVSDHGEEFFDHGGFSHGHDVYEEQVHVPLFFRWPTGGDYDALAERIDVPVSLVDILPTLTDYLGLSPPPGALAGRSLRPLLEDPAALEWYPVVSEAHIPKGWTTAYREGPLKVRFVHSEKLPIEKTRDIEVYDLAQDPGETNPITPQDPRRNAVVERAREHLLGIERRRAGPLPGEQHRPRRFR